MLLPAAQQLVTQAERQLVTAQEKITFLEKRNLDLQKQYFQEIVNLRDQVRRKVTLSEAENEDIERVFFDPLMHVDPELKTLLKDAVEEGVKCRLAQRATIKSSGDDKKSKQAAEVLRKQLEATQLEVETVRRQSVEQAKRAAAADEMLQAERKRASNVSEEINTLQKAKEQLTTEFRRLSIHAEKEKGETEKLKAEFTAKAEEAAREAQVFQQRIAAQEKDIKESKKQVQEMETQQKQLQKVLEKEVASAAEKEKEVQRIQKEYAEVKATLKEELAKPKADPTKVQAELEKARSEARAQATAEVEQRFVQQQRAQAAEEREEQEQIQQQLGELRAALGTSEAECRRLERLLKEMQAKLARLKQEASDMTECQSVAALIDGSGLENTLAVAIDVAERAVFKRLYGDALDRLVRLEKLRRDNFRAKETRILHTFEQRAWTHLPLVHPGLDGASPGSGNPECGVAAGGQQSAPAVVERLPMAAVTFNSPFRLPLQGDRDLVGAVAELGGNLPVAPTEPPARLPWCGGGAAGEFAATFHGRPRWGGSGGIAADTAIDRRVRTLRAKLQAESGRLVVPCLKKSCDAAGAPSHQQEPRLHGSCSLPALRTW